MSEISTGFMINQAGQVAIVFDDPNFVRSETIILDLATGTLHAVLHEQGLLIGNVSEAMAAAFANSTRVLLTSRRCDGSVLDLHADLVIYN